VYSLASGFIRLYVSIANMDKLPNCKWLRQTYQKEADELLARFISVNLFLTDHGKKLEAFDEIRCELNKQIGETDYTYRKVLHLQAFNNNVPQSYAFLKD
jgi:predicted type IV restriction endonuclease